MQLQTALVICHSLASEKDLTLTTQPSKQRYYEDEVALLVHNNAIDDGNNCETKVLNGLHSNTSTTTNITTWGVQKVLQFDYKK